MTRRRLSVRALVAAILTLMMVAVAGPAQADKPTPPRGPNPFPAGTAADAAAAAIGGLGLTRFSDTFAGLRVDGKAGRLTVYVTQPIRGKELVATGRAVLPGAIRSSVQVALVRAPHTRKELIAATAEVWRQAQGWLTDGVQVHSIAVRNDGTGLTVRVNDRLRATSAAARSTARSLAAVDLAFETGSPVTNVSRTNDSPPYWGGTPIKGDWDWSYRCTSAFGMQAGSYEYLMTADHCFDLGDNVEDPNADDIGYTRIRNFLDDATGIRGNIGGAAFLSNTYTDTYDRAAWSWTGQSVCQSGFTSAPNAICAIQVLADYIEWNSGDGIHRGVYGRLCDGCIAVRPGDSGGPVWIYGADGALESRGINSAGSEEVGNGYEYIYWTETPRILSDFGGRIITTSY
jgi:hypothetical protein